MSIEIVKIEKDNGGFSLWVSDEQEFRSSELFKVLAPLGIIESKRVHQSFAPAEFTDDIHTNDGVFSLHEGFDEFSGSTIYSESETLMRKILGFMLQSGQYHVR